MRTARPSFATHAACAANVPCRSSNSVCTARNSTAVTACVSESWSVMAPVQLSLAVHVDEASSGSTAHMPVGSHAGSAAHGRKTWPARR